MQNALDEHWTAAQVMKIYPETVTIFLALKMDCIGCSLAHFCSLREVAASYKIPPKLFLAQLSQAVKTNLENIQ